MNVAENGRVRVMVGKCESCIFRPGNLMHLKPGRVREMVASATRDESCIPCHETLSDDCQAVCRGFYDAHPTAPLQVAERLSLVDWHERAVL